MDSKQIREKYIKFFTEHGHKEIASAKLVPENDPSTLFTSSGMQPLVPYLLGQEHPAGKRLVNSQPCFRAEDIEEVGDNCHTTFFEMLGNWSLGDYFKKEQLPWIWEFLTKELGLPKEKLYVSIFEGGNGVPKDMETYEIWKSLGLSEEHIYFYGVDKNWWSRSGSPDKMPEGEIGGPDSEVFYEFTQVEHDQKYGEKCHPNCNCGRFLEIGNSVFIQYQKQADGTLKELDQKNVDFGGGLERLTAAVNNTPDIFQADLYNSIIRIIEQETSKKYEGENRFAMRIIADHLRAVVFIIAENIEPSNKLQGYIVRRLLRRAIVVFSKLADIDIKGFLSNYRLQNVIDAVLIPYKNIYPDVVKVEEKINQVIKTEYQKFATNMISAYPALMKVLDRSGDVISGEDAFALFDTHGVLSPVLEEVAKRFNKTIDWEDFESRVKKHQDLSRTASSGMFKGGLADSSEIVTRYHTATHLLHQALRDALGPEVFQKGSNITSERLRFDFSFERKLTDEEIKQVNDLVNKKIAEDLKVDRIITSFEEAKSKNAIGLFDEKYGSEVSIYGIGPGYVLDPVAKDQRERSGYYSLEICGGPHVEATGMIGKIKITKEEAVSAGIRRIRAQVVA